MSAGHGQVTARKETVTEASLVILAHLVTWEGCSQSVCGNVEETGKYEVSDL